MSEPKPKLTIVSIDSPALKVEAQFNPKEISVDKSVPWNKHKNPKGDIPMLEFTNAENRNMTFELFFDTFEQGTPVWAKIEPLHKMTLIRPVSTESEKHPPRVMVSWGGFQPFKGVIESLGVKYTMFKPDGTPVRATCSVKIKEVDEVQAPGGEGA
ncbi:hypothetical protein [Haliangium sp.]|uniref:CIS tube protein n=1 Tax=Haliangium sp. TaxID=2663208 RepID=UPI003D1527B9